ncbi:hypothetical protein FF80_03353 [Devosia sp. LC5]|uniref:hypothetical protein n=1 Tax=Devosia sp. LC5 TaxID=1502724 RepID=UPI0004E42B49|nr:hypothetical protein [Devosia sp. LC5]KFC62786.1 hypothetical protein FF80_03353 [Devosia sp. LC5]
MAKKQSEQAEPQQVSPMAALLALGGRHEVLDAYYSNRVKVLENDKLMLQARVAELEAEIDAMKPPPSPAN